MSDFTDGMRSTQVCECTECSLRRASFAALEYATASPTTRDVLEALKRRMDEPNPAIAAFACTHVSTSMWVNGRAHCFGCGFDLVEDYEGEFPRSPLGQTDALGYSRDDSEAARRAGVASDAVISRRANDPSSAAQVPPARLCSLCGALHGRWVKTHWKPGAKAGDKPCEGSWK